MTGMCIVVQDANKIEAETRHILISAAMLNAPKTDYKTDFLKAQSEFFYFKMKIIHPEIEIHSIATQVELSSMAATLQI